MQHFCAECLGGVADIRLQSRQPNRSSRPGDKRLGFDPQSTGVPCRFAGWVVGPGVQFSLSLLGPAGGLSQESMVPGN